MPKTSKHVLSTSRKHTTVPRESFGVARVRCWRPPVTGRQVIIFLFRSVCPCRRG